MVKGRYKILYEINYLLFIYNLMSQNYTQRNN